MILQSSTCFHELLENLRTDWCCVFYHARHSSYMPHRKWYSLWLEGAALHWGYSVVLRLALENVGICTIWYALVLLGMPLATHNSKVFLTGALCSGGSSQRVL